MHGHQNLSVLDKPCLIFGTRKFFNQTNVLKFCLPLQTWYYYRLFFLDAFSANCVFDFAETLSFCLEFWVFFLNIFKKAHFPLKNCTILTIFLSRFSFLRQFQPFQCIFSYLPLNFGHFLLLFFQILPKPWVFLLEFWVFSWGLSFFVLEFFSNGPKKKPVRKYTCEEHADSSS